MVQHSVIHHRRAILPAELLALVALAAVVVVAAASWFVRGGGGPPTGIEQVYIMNADGSGVRAVSPDPSTRQATPAWSPDGRSLVMSIGGGVDYEEPAHLWIVDLQTHEARQLTYGDGRDHLPAWSPDGSTIVFIKHDLPVGSAPSTLYSIRVDGTGLRQLTDGRSQATSASWSPDSSRLAFASDRDGSWQLYVMDADGSNVQKLEVENGVEPVWSPDGRTIAFMSDPDEGPFDILTLDLESGIIRRLTDNPAMDALPFWSPDSTRLVFISERGRRPEVYTMNADGSDVRNLTKASGFPGIRAAWSPDGKQIAFFGLFDEPREQP